MAKLVKTKLDQRFRNKLPPDKQDTIASIILEELEDERRWDRSFADSQDKLAQLAQKVRTDIEAGRIHRCRMGE